MVVVRFKRNHKLRKNSMGGTAGLTLKMSHVNGITNYHTALETGEVPLVRTALFPTGVLSSTFWTWVVVNVDHVHAAIKRI